MTLTNLRAIVEAMTPGPWAKVRARGGHGHLKARVHNINGTKRNGQRTTVASEMWNAADVTAVALVPELLAVAEAAERFGREAGPFGDPVSKALGVLLAKLEGMP